MSLFSQYIKERENFEAIEIPQGFVTYYINGKECYIRDVYVSPEYRRSSVASQLGDAVVEVAKKAKCSHVVGTIAPKAKGSTESMAFLIKYGFRLTSSDSQLIYLVKDL